MPPSESETPDEYLSDPAKPVPFVGFTTLGMAQSYMVADQRFASSRPDVLTYVSDILTGDLIVAGPLKPKLFLSSTATDSDFVVKLIDVYPGDYPELGGYRQLVRGEPFRAKFRDSFEQPKPVEVGKLFELNYSLPDICHVFRPGHRLMVQVQSSWFPLVDLNPQRFGDVPNMKAADFIKATQRLFHDARHPSAISLTAIPLAP